MMNLLAIEPPGHGQTRALKTESFTYWDTAVMNLQVMNDLGIEKAFASGTSQGGLIVAWMALLRPDRIQGIMPLGTSMDYESSRSHKLGCWDGIKAGESLLRSMVRLHSNLEAQANVIMQLGFGPKYDEPMRDFWAGEGAVNYGDGEQGKRRLRMCAINMRDRDGLHSRLADMKCPVLWMQGTADRVFSVAMAREEIGLLTGTREKELVVVDGGQHFLSASHAEEVGRAMVRFVTKWHDEGKAKL